MMKPNIPEAARTGEELSAELAPGLHAGLQAALSRKPDVAVPADFAERVAQRAGTLPPVPGRHSRSAARGAGLVMVAAVAVLLFALAPRTLAGFGSMAFDLELVILLQLALVTWWLSVERHTGR